MYLKLKRIGRMMMAVPGEPKKVGHYVPPVPTAPSAPASPPPADYDPDGSPAFLQLMEGIHDMNGHRAIALVQRLEDPVELRKVQNVERESQKKEGGRVGVMKAIDERIIALGVVTVADPSLEL